MAKEKFYEVIIADSLSGKLVTPDVRGEIPDLRFASSGMTSGDQVHIKKERHSCVCRNLTK